MKLIFAETHYWESAPRVDSHHLALHMARRGHDVLYLSSPISPFHFLQAKNFAHKWKRAAKYGGKGLLVEKHLRALVPFTIAPVHGKPVDEAHTRLKQMLERTVPSLPRLLKRLGFGAPDALIVQSLYFAALPDVMPDVQVIYRMTDDFDAFPGMPSSLIAAEPGLLGRANAVTVSARALVLRAQRLGAETIEILPHGVDVEFFAPKSEEGQPSRDRVIYVGAIDQWFDAERVAAAARLLPYLIFEIIGPIGKSADLTPVQNLRNVRFLGPRPFSQLPDLMSRARVGIIPFKRNQLIESVCPLKLLEYLAAGLHVVSTRWTELEKMNAPVVLVDTDEEFAAAVSRAMKENVHLEGIRFAEQYSWAKKAAQLEQIVSRIRR